MFDYLAAIGIGALVFIIFMLVFMKRDAGGRRGARLAGCQHHHSEQGCERCRSSEPVKILPQIPEHREK